MKYEFLKILKDNEFYISGETLLARAKELNAVGTKEDCDYLLAHPDELEGMKDYYVVFIGYPRLGDPDDITIVYWSGDRWVQYWSWLGSDWYGYYRVLRRKVSEPSDTMSLGSSVDTSNLSQALDTLTEAIEGVKKLIK